MTECVWCEHGFPIWSANPYIHLLGGEDSAVCKRGPIERELRALHLIDVAFERYSNGAERVIRYAAANMQIRQDRNDGVAFEDYMSEAIEFASEAGL